MSHEQEQGLNSMVEARRQTSRGLTVLPLLLMGATHLSIPPLRAMFEIEPRLMYGWYGIAIILGIVLFRKSRVIKDHEYNRAKAMKKIKHVYEAEQRGVWDTNVELNAAMDPATKAGLTQSVAAFSSEAPEMELEGEERVEVSMLTESQHVRKASARVSGEVSFDDEAITGTIGATRKTGLMDQILDGVSGIFGRDSRALREQRRQARLQASASSSPVVAQRPIAPLRLTKSNDDTEIDMTSMSDSGGVKTVISSSGQERDAYATSEEKKSLPSESLESMAMMGQAPSPSNRIQTSGPVCSGCQSPVTPSERFCPHCGLDL